MDISNCYKLWNEFLSVWPIERLKNMTLQEYSQAGDKDNFTYWVERETKPIANILGGSAFKFGIYHRSASEKKQNGRGKIYQEDYAWLEKYGATQEQAFNTVKQYILDTVAFIQQGNLDAIDALDFSPVFKWKIAFLYQNQAEPRVISIFSKTMLDFLTKDKQLNYAQVYQYLLSKKDDESLLQYSQDLVQQYLQAHPKKAYLTPNEADEILNAKYPDQYISRQKMTVVTNESGREIALVLTGSKASFFIEIDPEDNGQFKFNFKSSKDVPNGKYLEHDGRHSGLKSQSKNLWLGQKAFYIDIDSVDELEKFCDWYEQGTDHTTVFERQVNSSELMDSVMIQQPLNRILFGAAGTGKTFHSINHALSIIENKPLEVLEQEDRTVLKVRFDQYKEQGQIKFVTFHQSFSYEDFVEGIRAESIEDSEGSKHIEYPVLPGVFKSICDTATVKTEVEKHDTQFDEHKNRIWKMSLGRAGTDEDIYQYCIQNNCVLLGWGEDLDFSPAQNKKQIETLMDENGYSEYRKKYPSASRFVNDFKNKIKVGDLIIVSDGNHKFRAIAEVTGEYSVLVTGDDAPDYLQKRAVKWLNIFKPSLSVEHLFTKVLSQQTIYNLANAINLQKLKNILTTKVEVDARHQNFVLIIDEINRGNISRIFGELITLIEDSKRQGAEEELSVTLPYSKEEFSIPSNVYIIGTMNSSDRSLTGLDIALRRRFTFVEMPPKPEEIKNKDGELIKLSGKDKNGNDKEVIIADILSVMNQRIEVLLDRDHCIGHANFLSLKKQPTLEHLAVIFKQKIIPQLQEYFFDDWSKINMVLNANGMLKAQTVERSVLFPNVNTESEGVFEDQKTWQIVETAFDSIDSFAKIIRH